MIRQYIAIEQTRANYLAQAEEYARRNMPNLAADYAWMAANATVIARRLDAQARKENAR